MGPRQQEVLLKAQRNEITEHIIYARLAEKEKSQHNRKILNSIAKDELNHYNILKSVTKAEIGPSTLRVYFYTLLYHIFGITFSLRLMERGEELVIEIYRNSNIESLVRMLKDEQRHEKQLLEMLSEEKLEYAGSIVLGLNDALVELTGALAGLTFALANGFIIAIIGLITGTAASLSMAASAYFSSREDFDTKPTKSPIRSALYTGITYFITVLILITPFMLIGNIYIALAATITSAILIIAFYTFYISTARDLPFWGRFSGMAAVSLGVAAITFLIGMLVRIYFGIEV